MERYCVDLAVYFWLDQFQELPPIQNALAVIQLNAPSIPVLRQREGNEISRLIYDSYDRLHHLPLSRFLSHLSQQIKESSYYQDILLAGLLAARDGGSKLQFTREEARIRTLYRLKPMLGLIESDIESILTAYYSVLVP